MPPAAARRSTPCPTSRGATINVHYSISKIPQHRLSAAAGRRPRRLLPHGRSRIFRARATATSSSATSTAGTCKRPTRRPTCRRRRSRSSSTSRRRCRSNIARRSTTASTSGTRPSRRPALQRHRSATAGGQGRHGSGRHPLQLLPLDHQQRRLRDGPQPRESVHGPDPRRRHHLRRRLPARRGSRSTRRSLAAARSPR